MRSTSLTLAVSAFVLALLGGPVRVNAADVILSGSIKSSDGAAMNGVMVSAKPEGGTITTTVLTDEAGRYYFPPLATGKYRVWAQALSFATAKGEIDLGAVKQQAFTLRPMEDFFRQLPGNVMLSALPEDNEQDRRMKVIVRNNCTACHTASYVLQHRFDEAGWSAIVELMKNVNVYGSFVGASRPPSGILDYHQKELAAYLAKARGPGANSGENGMTVKLEPRATGEAARVMFKEYEVPLDADAGLPKNFVQNDGSDWSLGTPSVMIPGWGVHDAWLDSQGDLWFTCNIPNKQITIGRIAAKTGEVKLFAILTPSPALRRGQMDAQDRLWFGEYRGDKIGVFDTKIEKFTEWAMPTRWTNPYDVTLDKNEEAWTGSMLNDRVVRLNTKTGDATEYLLPRSTNIRRVFVDNSTTPVTFWVGSNHGASIIKLEPLD